MPRNSLYLFCLGTQSLKVKLNPNVFLLLEMFWFSIAVKQRWHSKDRVCSDGNKLSARNVILLKDTAFSEKKMKVQIFYEHITAQVEVISTFSFSSIYCTLPIIWNLLGISDTDQNIYYIIYFSIYICVCVCTYVYSFHVKKRTCESIKVKLNCSGNSWLPKRWVVKWALSQVFH